MSRSALLASCALLALAVGAARADTQAINVTSVGQIAYSPPFPSNGFNYYQGPGGYTFSWDFTANSAIKVTQLGYYDSVLAGTAEPAGGFGAHNVTLTDVTAGTTLATTVVTSTSPATGVFNYQPITPVTLNTGDTYQISGNMTTQYYLVGLNQSAAPTASQVNYQFAGGGTLFGYPPPAGTYGDFGANFQFTAGAACTQNRAGLNVIALSGDTCTAAPGAYNPTTSTVTLPVTYNGFGFYAHGGSIDSPGNVSIATTDPNGAGGSHAIWADGTGSAITLEGSTTISAGGANSFGVYATAGGVVSATGAVTVTTTGAGASGLYVTGAGSAIKATLGAVSTSGARAFGALADNGGSLTLTGGSIATTGVTADGVVTLSGAAATLAGVQISTAGAGAKGVTVQGTGTTFNGSNLIIATSGATDTTTGYNASGVYNGNGNGSAGGASGGAVVSLTNSSVTTSGAIARGVVTENGGATTLTGGSVTTSGVQSDALFGSSSSTTTLSNVQLTTSGNAAKGIDIEGAGTRLTGSGLTISTAGTVDPATGFHAQGVYNGSSVPASAGETGGGVVSLTQTSVTTKGANSFGVDTDNGGSTTFTGGSIATSGVRSDAVYGSSGSATTLTNVQLTTSGNAAKGIDIEGTGTRLTGSGLTISTAGTIDTASGFHAQGVYNGSSTPPATGTAGGGVVSLTQTSVTTKGANSFGVDTDNGGSTTFTGGSITTSGAGAVALLATGAGSTTSVAADANGAGTTIAASGASAAGVLANSGGSISLAGATVSTAGAGAHGLYVTGAGSTATLNGAVGITVSGANAAGVYVDAGGAVAGPGALTVKAATYGLYVNGGAATTSLSLAGPLSLTTTASGAALTLNGANASFAGAGGGVIDAAGTAIALLNGASQSASFANYQINSPQGDLIYADPSNSTVSFTNTTANAGAGNLANVTNGSDVTLNAAGSALTGVITTTAGSVSNVNLNSGSSWTITGPSTVTNLSLTNSSAAFASGGGFKTLTTTNYAGTGATLTFNAAFGGTNSGADQLVINGGRATGTTVIAVNPLGTASGRTSVPLVTTANGGTIAPGAFTLSGPLVVGGLVYTLQGQSDGENLVSAPGITPAQASGSLATLAQSRQTQAITGHVLGSILTGATEQINCSACSSGFASFGSFALGAHGRWTLTPSVTLLAGLSYDSYSGRGVTVNNALMGALALRYDPAQLGRYRPFVEAGLLAEPYANVSFRRSYASTGGGGVGVGDTLSRSVAAYGRIGYIWRLSRIDEAAVYTDLTKSWQWEAGYVESASGGNPFGAAVAPSLDTMNVWRVGGQYTHLFGEHVEADVSVGYAQAFAANYGSTAAFSGLGAASGAAPSSFGWGELGGRISYRFSRNVTGDVFVLGTVGAEPAGDQVHGGVALRMAF